MKKRILSIIIAAICLICAAAFPAFAQSPCQVTVYGTGNEGLALKESPDVNAARYLYIPEGTSLYIDQVYDGWGHTGFNGSSGWVALQYTKIQGYYNVLAPSYGWIPPANYTVSATDGEGLELRVEPGIHSSTFGPVPEGTGLVVEAIINDWAYTGYNGRMGWCNLAHLTKWTNPAVPTENYYNVMVYNTEGEGLAMKSSPDVNSQRYFLIPEQTVLTIDSVSENGWGHTTCSGYSGWVALRYTRILGSYPTKAPSWGQINPKYYTVTSTDGEGLELRNKPTIETSSFGAVPDGVVLTVTAVNNDWAYTSYNGNNGWCNMMYLR